MSTFDIAGFVNALFWIYYMLIFVRVIFSWIKPPAHGALHEIYRFVYNVTEPYLGIFRRFIPSTGGIDFSPFLGMIVLIIIQRIVVGLVAGL